MTDRAKELLEQAYQYIPMSSITSQEIRAFLSTPEPTQDEEPIGYVEFIEDAGLNFCTLEPAGDYPYQPLYLHPAPRQDFVRLSEEELKSCFTETNEAEPLAEGWPGLERFARAIEDALEEKNSSTIPSLNATISANNLDSGHE